MNLSRPFDGGLAKGMREAACPLGGMDSSNPQRRRGWQLHHHGGGVCCVFVLLWMDSGRHEFIACQKVRENNPKVGLWV